MARTPLARKLTEICGLIRSASVRKISADQVLHERLTKRVGRREFCLESAKLGTLMSGAAALSGCETLSPGARAQSIVIIGAGLAGLTCAFRLKQAGLNATVYEAAGRLGGRCLTNRGFFAENQIAERGGELIDTGHTAVRRLAGQLGLPLDDLRAAELKGTDQVFNIKGGTYSLSEAAGDFRPVYPRLQSDSAAAGYPTLHDRFTPRGLELDRMSIRDWITRHVPGGLDSRLGRLLDVAYQAEYGLETDALSALNLIYLLGASPEKDLHLYGDSDTRFSVRGGNDQLVTRMAMRLEGQIETGTRLAALARTAGGRFALTLETQGATQSRIVDHVVLALPFVILRSGVDCREAGFSPLKQTAIQELGMGANTKLQMQFTDRHWRTLGCNGETFADTGYQCTWEGTRAQAGQAGILINFTGGAISPAPGRQAIQAGTGPANFLTQIEPVLPGLTAKWNGKTTVDNWTHYPWINGSYSIYKTGQFTRFAGIEGRREGNCHFAGEHTSIEFQGYLNGAVESGERAAREILTTLRAG